MALSDSRRRFARLCGRWLLGLGVFSQVSEWLHRAVRYSEGAANPHPSARDTGRVLTGKDIIRAEERFRSRLYLDAHGTYSIGYGRNLSRKGISKVEGELLLDNDYNEHVADILQRIPWASELDPVRFAVLVSMRHQLGMAGLLRFKAALNAMKYKNWDAAYHALMDSQWARKDSPERALRHALMVATGEWRLP